MYKSNIYSIYYKNTSKFRGYEQYYQNNSFGQYTHYLPGNFTTTEWGGNASFIFNNGSLEVHGRNSSFTLDYNDSMAGQPGGIQVINPNTIIHMTLSFSMNVTKDTKGFPYLMFLGEGSKTSQYTSYEVMTLNVSTNSTLFSYNTTFPPGTAYFGFRFGFSSFSGSAKIGFVNISYSPIAYSSADTPLGSYINVSNAKLNIPIHYSSAYIFYSISSDGTGPILEAHLLHNQTIVLNGSVFGVVAMRGVNSGYRLPLYAVVNEPVLKDSVIRDGNQDLTNYFLGYDGSFIYQTATKNLSIGLNVNNLVELKIAYAILVIFSFYLIIAVATPSWASIINNWKSILLKKKD